MLSMPRIRIVYALFALTLASSLALPASTHAQNSAAQSAQTPAGQFVQDLGNKAIGVVADKGLNTGQRNTKYREILRAAFDMPAIGKFVLGRAWNTATPQQQQEYMKLFEQMVLRIYGDRMNFYGGESFRVTGSHAENDQDIIVNSEILHPDAQPTSVDWRVRKNGGTFAIVDVSVAGVSQSITQRQEFASILSRNNGNIDALLDMMRSRVQANTNAAQ